MMDTAENVNLEGGRNQDKSAESSRTEKRGNKPSANAKLVTRNPTNDVKTTKKELVEEV